MNRIWTAAIAILIVVLAITLVLYLAQSSGPPQDVRARVSAYASTISRTSGQYVSSERVVRAARPERFQEAMSKATYADSAHFATTSDLMGIIDPGSVNQRAGSRPLLPYPPVEAWCAQLSNGDTIVIALHRDIYYADWIVHEINNQAATAATIVCKLTAR